MRLAARALGLQRGPLADAESVLLIDDRQPEARELDRLADDSVRPDDDLCHPAGDRVVDLALASEVREPERNSDRTPSPSSRGASPA